MKYIVVFFLFVGIFFSPVILQGKLPVPSDTLVGLYHPWRDQYAGQYPRGMPFKNFLITDPIRQQIPWRKIGMEELKKGELPMWNPYAFGGTPLLGNIQSGIFYPLNIVFFFLRFDVAWTVLIMLQPLMAGMFLFVYLSSKKIHPWANVTACIVWSFSGFSIAWLTWGTIVHTALWIPIFLLSIDHFLGGKSKKEIFLWSVVFTLSLSSAFFAGHVQVFLYSALLALCYALFQWRSQKISLTRIHVVAGFFVGGIFALITFLQWKELFALVQISSRVGEENLMNKEGWFLPVQHLIQFFIPDFFGNPATLNYWGTWNYGECIGFIGVMPLFFACVALLRVRLSHILFWIGTGVVSLVFMLSTPIATLPYSLGIPIWSTLQPTRLMVLVVFSLVILSAHGLDSLTKKTERTGGIRILFAIFFLIFSFSIGVSFFLPKILNLTTTMNDNLAVSLRNSILPFAIFLCGSVVFATIRKREPRSWILVAFLVLTALDLFRFGKKFTPFVDAAYFFPQTRVIEYLSAQEKPFRVLSADDRILPSNVAGYYGIEMVSGYDPLYSAYYEGVIAAHNRNAANLSKPYGFNRIITPALLHTPLWEILGITYVLTYGPVDDPSLLFVFNEGETHVYKVISPLGRFFFTPQVIATTTYEQSIGALFMQKNLRHTAVVQGNVTITDTPIQEGETITVDAYGSSSIRLTTYTLTSRFMVILNSFFPGWYATIDGEKTPIYQTNGAFMGIVVPQGEHDVRLVYGI